MSFLLYCSPWLTPFWLPLSLVIFPLDVDSSFASNVQYRRNFPLCLLTSRPLNMACWSASDSLVHSWPILIGSPHTDAKKETDFLRTFLVLGNMSFVSVNCILPTHWLKLKQLTWSNAIKYERSVERSLHPFCQLHILSQSWELWYLLTCLLES